MPEKFPNFNAEQERLFKELDKLRNEAHTRTEKETEERIKNNPKPTEEEILAGAFREMIEPQVRDALFEMYKKGYGTESSGFGGENSEYQQIDGYFELDEKSKKKLESAGVKILKGKDIGLPGFGENYTFIRFFPKNADIDKIKKEWDEIVSLLPQKTELASPSISGASDDFRKQFAPDRIDIEKAVLEKQLASGEFSPETEQTMKKRLEEIKIK